MDSRNKKTIGISILITVLSFSLFSVGFYLFKTVNITINTSPKDDKKMVEVTSTPTTSPPTETSSTDTTTPQQTNTPTPTASPTEQPTLTVKITDNTEKITEKDLEKYCLNSSNTNESDNKDNDEKDNTTQTTNENNQEKTIDIKEASQIVIATNPEQVDDDSNIMTISHSKRTVHTITQDTENETTVTNAPENTTSPEDDENIGEDDNTPDSSEDLEPTSQTFSLNEICNYNFSETNNIYNIKYINVEPGEYTFILNNSSIVINYYVIPNTDSLFTDSEETTAPNASEEEPLYDENQETE